MLLPLNGRVPRRAIASCGTGLPVPIPLPGRHGSTVHLPGETPALGAHCMQLHLVLPTPLPPALGSSPLFPAPVVLVLLKLKQAKQQFRQRLWVSVQTLRTRSRSRELESVVKDARCVRACVCVCVCFVCNILCVHRATRLRNAVLIQPNEMQRPMCTQAV